MNIRYFLRDKIRKKIKRYLEIFCATSFLIFLPTGISADNIDATYKYSWGENTGRMNWATTPGSVEKGVTVYSECLTGYIWGENHGWMSVGDTGCAGGDCCQSGTAKGYENDTNNTDDDGDGVADDWGVNNDGAGNLSGYAWGENTGWISFKDTVGSNFQVTISSTSTFEGYAWGEGVGWISMNCANDSSCGTLEYKVITSWSSGNQAPVVSTVVLNGGTDITLIENTTKAVSAIGAVSDGNGYADISSVQGRIYRSGVGSACTLDNDNCYEDASCALSNCSGNSCDYTCDFNVQFYAEPTDSGAYGSENWLAWVKVTDSQSSEDTDISAGVELNTLQSLNITTPISYGTVAVGENSTGDHTATATNTGNAAIDVQISGAVMSCTTRGSVPVGSQEYALASFNYGAGTDLTGSPVDWNLDLAKPDSGTPTVTDATYWQIGMPAGVEGTCNGTNTFTSRSAL